MIVIKKSYIEALRCAEKSELSPLTEGEHAVTGKMLGAYHDSLYSDSSWKVERIAFLAGLNAVDSRTVQTLYGEEYQYYRRFLNGCRNFLSEKGFSPTLPTDLPAATQFQAQQPRIDSISPTSIAKTITLRAMHLALGTHRQKVTGFDYHTSLVEAHDLPSLLTAGGVTPKMLISLYQYPGGKALLHNFCDDNARVYQALFKKDTSTSSIASPLDTEKTVQLKAYVKKQWQVLLSAFEALKTPEGVTIQDNQVILSFRSQKALEAFQGTNPEELSRKLQLKDATDIQIYRGRGHPEGASPFVLSVRQAVKKQLKI